MIYDAGRIGAERGAPGALLEALVEDVATHDQARIVFDLDETLRGSSDAPR